MRILHTSDWHLGRSFHRVDLLAAQAAQLDHLVEVVRAEQVDVVVVAGDIYDRALPGVDAVQLLDDALHRLTGAGASVVLSSGNHDSPRRLGFGSRLMAKAGVHVRTDPAQVGEPVLLADEHGEVAFYPLPYLEPALAADLLSTDHLATDLRGTDLRGTDLRGTDLRGTDLRGTDQRGTDQRGTDQRGTDQRGTDQRGTDQRGTDQLKTDLLRIERSQAGVLQAAMSAVRADLAGRPGVRSVVSAHAFVTGGVASDSERELAVGGLGQVAASTFDGVDYVALGHLHGRQQLGPTVRYSGSPLAFSFGEAGHRKGSWLIDLAADGVRQVESIEAPVPRALARLHGTLEELLGDDRFTGAEAAWCQITLTDPVRPAEPMERLRRRFPHVLELRLEPSGTISGGDAGYTARIAGQGDLDVCCGFLQHVRQRPASADESLLLQQALEASLLNRMEGVSPADPALAEAAAEPSVRPAWPAIETDLRAVGTGTRADEEQSA